MMTPPVYICGNCVFRRDYHIIICFFVEFLLTILCTLPDGTDEVAVCREIILKDLCLVDIEIRNSLIVPISLTNLPLNTLIFDLWDGSYATKDRFDIIVGFLSLCDDFVADYPSIANH